MPEKWCALRSQAPFRGRRLLSSSDEHYIRPIMKAGYKDMPKPANFFMNDDKLFVYDMIELEKQRSPKKSISAMKEPLIMRVTPVGLSI
jgi:hypothetical protein